MAKQKQEIQKDDSSLFLTIGIAVGLILGACLGFVLFHDEVKDEWRVSNEDSYATYVQDGNTYHLTSQASWQTCHIRSFQDLKEKTCRFFSTHDDAVAFAKSKGGLIDEVVKP